jgi:hypothetical protein
MDYAEQLFALNVYLEVEKRMIRAQQHTHFNDDEALALMNEQTRVVLANIDHMANVIRGIRTE